MSACETRPGIVEQQETPDPMKIAVLISNKGTGSNLKSIIDAINNRSLHAEITTVISDQPDAKGLEHASNNNIPWEVMQFRGSGKTRKAYSLDVATYLNQKGAQVVIMAGYGTILTKDYLDTFQGVTINVHPGLIPDIKTEPWRFPDGAAAPWNRGMMTVKAAGNFIGMTYAGSSVHVVTEEPDFGPVLERVIIYTQPDDNVDSLYARLKLQEHQALIRSLNKIQQRQI